jgi:hypothetical protein
VLFRDWVSDKVLRCKGRFTGSETPEGAEQESGMEIEWAGPCATSARWFTVHKASMCDHSPTSLFFHALVSVVSLACNVQITRDPGVPGYLSLESNSTVSVLKADRWALRHNGRISIRVLEMGDGQLRRCMRREFMRTMSKDSRRTAPQSSRESRVKALSRGCPELTHAT